MDGKVFTKETKDLIVKAADELVKLPFYLEPFDGPGFRVVVNFIDSKADKFVPDTIDPLINEGITSAFDGKFDLASEKIGTALNMVVDVPLLDEDNEQKMFVDGIRFIIRVVENWVEKKKEA